MSQSSSDLVDVRDEFSLSGHVDLLVVGSHLTLDGEEKNLQVSLLCEPEEMRDTTAEEDGQSEEVELQDVQDIFMTISN